MAGCEGVLGVITAARCACTASPEAQRYEGWLLPGFEAGCDALRQLEQAGPAPDVARLSDEDETRFTLALAVPAGSRGASARALARRAPAACWSLGWGARREASPAPARRPPAAARRGRDSSGQPAGRALGASRFDGPHLRDDLLDRGVMVETLETATTWSNLGGAAARGAGGAAGPARRLPRLAPLPHRRLAVLHRPRPPGRAIRPLSGARSSRAATDAIVAAGGTITHHHAVGRDHAPWMAAEVGELGVGCCAR